MITQATNAGHTLDLTGSILKAGNPLNWLHRIVKVFSDTENTLIQQGESYHSKTKIHSRNPCKTPASPKPATIPNPLASLKVATHNIDKVDYNHPTLDDNILNMLVHVKQGEIDNNDLDTIKSILLKKGITVTTNNGIVMFSHGGTYDDYIFKKTFLGGKCYPREKNNDNFFRVMLENDGAIDYTDLQNIALSRMDYLLCLMLSGNVIQETKEKLLNFVIKSSSNTEHLFSIDSTPLTKKTYPFMLTGLENPYINLLRRAIFFSDGFLQINSDLGDKMIEYTREKSNSDSETLGFTTIPDEHFPSGHLTTCGGRTIKMESNDKTSKYYKFHRQKETLKDFLIEGHTYDFIEKNQEDLQYKSDIPRKIGVYYIPMEKITKLNPGFSDKPQEHNMLSEKHYLVFVYEASVDYCSYSHTMDPNPPTNDPFDRPIKGILNYYYDIGRSHSMGMTFPSVLPATHSGYTRWSSFPRLPFGHNLSCGVLSAWDGRATDLPDISITGLRDWGDHVPLKNICKHICIYREESEIEYASGLSQEIKDRYTGSCILSDNLIAGVIIWARLKRQENKYHYKNNESINEFKEFFEAGCNQFLKGLLGDNDSTKDLRSFMNLGDNYDPWITRMASEVLYWTYDQKKMYIKSGKKELRDKTNIDFKLKEADCYEGHLWKNNSLPKEFFDCYKDSETYDIPIRHFLDSSGGTEIYSSRDLGCRQDYISTFPLIQLVNGVTIFVSKVLTHNLEPS